MQIEGGTAAVRVFRFEDHDNMIQCQSECSFSNCGVDILVARNVVETIQFGCHVAGPFRTLLHKDFFSAVSVDIPYVIGCRDACES